VKRMVLHARLIADAFDLLGAFRNCNFRNRQQDLTLLPTTRELGLPWRSHTLAGAFKGLQHHGVTLV